MRSLSQKDTNVQKKSDFSIVCCHHTGELLYKFLDSIRKSVGVTYEIIVITSDSSMMNKLDDCIVFYTTVMPAEKRNIGVTFARGKYLAFFDDDTEIDSDCLKYYKFYLDHLPNIGMVYGKLHKADEQNRFDEAGGFMTETGFIWSRAGQNIVDDGQYDISVPVLAGKSASCAIRREVFDEVMGFDESFGILGEETDLSWRVWLKGHEVYFIPEARGIHYFNTKFKPVKQYYNSERVQYNGCRNYLTMLLKNLGKEHLWIVPIHASIWFTAGLAMIGTGKLRQGWNIWRGLGYVMSHFSEIMQKRRLIQQNRKIDERTLWAIISRSTPRGYYTQRFKRYLSIGLHG